MIYTDNCIEKYSPFKEASKKEIFQGPFLRIVSKQPANATLKPYQ